MIKWINITGLVLQFLSFWFAAPELLGSQTLKRFESGLIRFLSRLPSYLLGLIGIFFGITMGVYGAYKGFDAQQNPENITKTLVVLFSVSCIYIVYMIFYKKVQKWIERIFAKPLINNLITNNKSRQLALITGAVLFTIGFLCQFVVLLIS